jgi:hypothetical protein
MHSSRTLDFANPQLCTRASWDNDPVAGFLIEANE